MAGTVTPIPYPYTPIVGTSQHNLACVAATKLTVPNGAIYAIIQAATASVKYTTDGTTPTASIGMTLAVGASVALVGYAPIAALQAISATGTLDVEYFQ